MGTQIKASQLMPQDFSHYFESRDIVELWMLRQIIEDSMVQLLVVTDKPPRGVRTIRKRLRLPAFAELREAHDWLENASQALAAIEQSACSFTFNKFLSQNLILMRREFGFSDVELRILAWAVLLNTDDDLYQLMARSENVLHESRELSRVLGLPQLDLEKALSRKSRLSQSGLVNILGFGNLSKLVTISTTRLRSLAQRYLSSVEEMLPGIVQPSPKATLSVDDYAHVTPSVPRIIHLISHALDSGQLGVNILLYGPPGTGKTQLARLLADSVKVPLFDVADKDGSGDALKAEDRLSNALMAQGMLKHTRALLCFDEVETIFTDGSSLFGKPSTAQAMKSAFNRMLEENRIPTIWIANSIGGIDPAFVRRFDLILKIETPPRSQRLRLLERELTGLASNELLHRMAHVKTISPAIITRSASVVRRMVGSDASPFDSLVENVVDGILVAQRHAPLKRSMPSGAVRPFDPTFCNAYLDLAALSESVRALGSARICLFGPPGTGKTAFGHFLSEQLDKPLISKRASDLLGMHVGETEAKIRMAFEEAVEEDAILQMDEFDSFLQNRSQAVRNYEVTQVNEFLTCLEEFDGVFVATTNRLEDVDPAALRRLDYKIKMDYMTAEQALAMFRATCAQFDLPLASLDVDVVRALSQVHLTPGDFAVVLRRHKLSAFESVGQVVKLLVEEATVAERGEGRRIGFL